MSARKSSGGNRRRVTFEVQCAPGAKVFLAGSFNDWDPAGKPMADTVGDGHFRAICLLSPGTYEYKFVIDGEWGVDSANPNFVVNAMGSLNSVIQVS